MAYTDEVETRSLIIKPESEGWSVFSKSGGEPLCTLGLRESSGRRAGLFLTGDKGSLRADALKETLEALLHYLFFDRGYTALELKTKKSPAFYAVELKSLGFEESLTGHFTVLCGGYFPCGPLSGRIGYDNTCDGVITLRDRGVFDMGMEERGPRYYFSIYKEENEIGYITFRPGIDPNLAIEGNLGYYINEENRGAGLAGRAARLILPLAERHGMKRLIIANHATNTASVRVCEKLGARLVRVAPVSETHPLWAQGRRRQNIFVLDI